MKKTLFLIPFLTLALIARAQDFQTEIALVEALDFNGATLAKAPAGKNATLQLARTKFSVPLGSYTSLALPTLKLGNIIGHPTLGWDDTDFRIPEGVPAVYEGKWALNDVFTDGDFPVAIYGRMPSEKPFPWGKSEKELSCRGRDPHLIMLLDPTREVKRVYNVRNLSITPKDSLFEDIHWAVVKDGVLYFSISTLTAPEDGNSIICGLGGSGIPDYIYVLNRFTGVKTREYWIPSAASWFAIGDDNTLYAALYDKHVAFKITK